METANKTRITVSNTVNAPVDKVWEYYNGTEHIPHWNFASDDWQCPWAKSDFRTGGQFSSRMEAKDGSMGFEFGGVYDAVEKNKRVAYTMGDGRSAEVIFTAQDNATKVDVSFDTENTFPVEMQRGGWQAILDNFKKYTESN